MHIATLSIAGPTPTQWSSDYLRILQHEYGVAVDWSAEDVTDSGRLLRSWINDYRSHGHGAVMPIVHLRLRALYHWHGLTHGERPYERRARSWGRTGAVTPEQRAAAVDQTDWRLCQILNDSRSGLLLTQMHRCPLCGAA